MKRSKQVLVGLLALALLCGVGFAAAGATTPEAGAVDTAPNVQLDRKSVV